MTINTLNLEKSWSVLEPLLTIRNEMEYQQSLEQLHDLIDQVGTDEQHPLYSLLDTLGILVEAYEAEHVQIPDVTGVDLLQYLIEEQGLTLADLPEIGAQGDVLQVLNGEQELSLQQIRAVSERFQVSPAVFI
ncbi:MAG: transcriptional regulator [Cyanobacteria bacterium P01_F01_bin.56]